MTICFTCPGCGASHIASPKDAGKLVDCKRCGLRQNVPNFPLQPTILGEVRRPNFPHGTSKANTLESEILPQENNDSHHSPSNLSQGEKLKNPDASEQTGDFVSLTARRSRSKTRQLIFLIIGGLVFFGIGIIVLFMIVNRAAELQSSFDGQAGSQIRTKNQQLDAR